MEKSNVLFMVVVVCCTVAFCAMVNAGKSCNDSDNAIKTRMIDRGCAYLGDGKFICKGALTDGR